MSWLVHLLNRAGNEHRCPNTNTDAPFPEHRYLHPKHIQKPNTEENSKHKHLFSEPQTLFFASPHFKAGSERPRVQH